MKQQLIVKTLWWPDWENAQPVLFAGRCLKSYEAIKASVWYFGGEQFLFTVREAVKLPLMWKLWSHEDVNKLRRQHTALKHFPARCTWTRTVEGLLF